MFKIINEIVLVKLPAHRAGLPGKEISFILCPLTPPTRRGLRGTCRSCEIGILELIWDLVLRNWDFTEALLTFYRVSFIKCPFLMERLIDAA